MDHIRTYLLTTISVALATVAAATPWDILAATSAAVAAFAAFVSAGVQVVQLVYWVRDRKK